MSSLFEYNIELTCYDSHRATSPRRRLLLKLVCSCFLYCFADVNGDEVGKLKRKGLLHRAIR